ncbi:MAG: bifunctional glutamate N-acetyltransferase/amino-acid acetyltransferase ArgJ, partial [Candidatus Promineifilaceae bacterium]
CTGQPGIEAAKLMQAQASALLGLEPEQFLLMSTGVIGQQLPLDKIGTGIEISASNLSPDNGSLAARAIMTTDTCPKSIGVCVTLSGGDVMIGGIAKGSGMIHPNMATMLGTITTDAQIDVMTLQDLLRHSNELSFNRISVDGDTSTNDTVLLLANGAAGFELTDDDLDIFEEALTHVCQQLAQMIVRDGEGAKKFVEIQVQGASHDILAHQIANTIATSPLVKTAFAGGDANWGRIMAAAGRAGVAFDQEVAALWFSSNGESWLQVFEAGTPTDFEEEHSSAIFAQKDIWVRLSIGDEAGEATVWTCDMTHEYITINADYRT